MGIITKQIDSSVGAVTENYNKTLASIIELINKKNYVVRINGKEVSSSELNNIVIDLSHLTKSGRKKVAKRLWVYSKKKSLKSINFLYHVLFKMNVIKDKVSVSVSHKEAEIQAARKLYVKLRTESEAARIAYKTVKGDFYKQ